MIDAALLLLSLFLIGRSLWQFLSGVADGAAPRRGPAGGRGAAGPPAHGIQMVRDPVCGTFLLPSSACTLDEGNRRTYFCSERCRDRYRERSA